MLSTYLFPERDWVISEELNSGVKEHLIALDKTYLTPK
jgi:hypothetical protein